MDFKAFLSTLVLKKPFSDNAFLQAFDMPFEMACMSNPFGMPVAGILRNAWKCLRVCMSNGFSNGLGMDLICISPGIRKYPGRAITCLRKSMWHACRQAFVMPAPTPVTRHVQSLKMDSKMDLTRHLKWIWYAFHQAFVSTLVGLNMPTQMHVTCMSPGVWNACPNACDKACPIP